MEIILSCKTTYVSEPQQVEVKLYCVLYYCCWIILLLLDYIIIVGLYYYCCIISLHIIIQSYLCVVKKIKNMVVLIWVHRYVLPKVLTHNFVNYTVLFRNKMVY